MSNERPQLDLFNHVLGAYTAVADRPVGNAELYQAVAQRACLDTDEAQRVEPVGEAQAPRNVFHRKVRWYQQTLKNMGLLQRVEGKRGLWELTERAQKGLHPIRRTLKVLAFSTDLGVAIWGDSEDVFQDLDVPITLCFTSPPYPLRRARNYGNVDCRAIVDFICQTLAPALDKLADDGSLVINLTNDIFEERSPARSTYLERLVLALEDNFGLHLMDRFVWHNPTKPPGPLQWASLTRQQLNVAYEPVMWFAKDPHKVKSDNRRVLQPHTSSQQALISRGGEKRHTSYGDGAYTLRPGSFGAATAGTIPRNVLQIPHRCRWSAAYRQHAQSLGLPLHGAGMPYTLPEFMIRFLTEPGDLVADPFGGRSMTGRAAESLGRMWFCVEKMLEYAIGGSALFADCSGFRAPLLDAYRDQHVEMAPTRKN